MSSTAYDRYMQSAGSIASAVQGIEGNLYKRQSDAYTTEANRENTKKTIDIGKASFDIAQGEGLVGQAVALGTAGLAGIQGTKKVASAVRSTYSKHYGKKKEEGDEDGLARNDEEAVEGELGEPSHPSSTGMDQNPATAKEGAVVETDLRAPTMADLPESLGKLEPDAQAHLLGGGHQAGLDTLPEDEPGHIELMEGGDYNRTRAEAQRYGIRRYDTAGEASFEGTGGAGAGAEGAVGEGMEASEGFLSRATSAVSQVAEGGLEGIAEKSFVGDLALQALPFVGEAVDLGLMAYGIVQGVDQYQKGQAESAKASGDPINPPSDFGQTNPSLNNNIAIPVFDSSRGHDSGHVSAF